VVLTIVLYDRPARALPLTERVLCRSPSACSVAHWVQVKERKLFQELFARCTAVCCSTGNETIWEAACRGVPVLTIPTFQHGEQIMNAVAHARALPLHVRTATKLRIADVRWLTSFEHSDASRKESAGLRERCANAADGLDQLLQAPAPAKVVVDTGKC
jgi:UDP:flavonoid glycosyltransferase YjiC (YdhE family)